MMICNETHIYLPTHITRIYNSSEELLKNIHIHLHTHIIRIYNLSKEFLKEHISNIYINNIHWHTHYKDKQCNIHTIHAHHKDIQN